MTDKEHGQFATVGVTRFEVDHLRNFVVLLDHHPATKGAALDLQKWIEDKASRPALFDGARANSPTPSSDTPLIESAFSKLREENQRLRELIANADEEFSSQSEHNFRLLLPKTIARARSLGTPE